MTRICPTRINPRCRRWLEEDLAAPAMDPPPPPAAHHRRPRPPMTLATGGRCTPDLAGAIPPPQPLTLEPPTTTPANTHSRRLCTTVLWHLTPASRPGEREWPYAGLCPQRDEDVPLRVGSCQALPGQALWRRGGGIREVSGRAGFGNLGFLPGPPREETWEGSLDKGPRS